MSGGVAHGERERQASPLVLELPVPSRLPLQGRVRAEEQEGRERFPHGLGPSASLKVSEKRQTASL